MEIISNIVTRHHLFDSLDREQLARLIIIYAPSGVGKTQVALQLSDAVGVPVVWHSLDQWQHDVATLHRHCIYAWSQQLPDIAHAISEPKQDPHDAAELLTNYLADNLRSDAHTLYVLDDVQHLNDYPDATQWLQLLIDRLPSQVHLVLVGQKLPPLSWVALVSRGQVTVIDAERLRFTAQEVQQIRDDITPERAAALVSQYEGWISGIQLALQGGSDDALARPYTPKNHDVLFKEMAIDVLEAQAPPMQDFLLATSTPAHFTTMQAEALLDIDSHTAEYRVRELLQRQLFIIEPRNGAFAYHQMFREALQDYAQRERHSDYRKWHRHMAIDADARDDIEATVYHWLQAEDPHKAAAKAQICASDYFRGGRWRALLDLQKLVMDQDTPRLNLLVSVILTEFGEYTESNTMLDRARQSFERKGDGVNVLRTRIQYAFNLQRMGRNRQALEILLVVLDDPHVIEILDLQQWALRTRAHVYRNQGRYQAAVLDLRRALELRDRNTEKDEYLRLLLDLSDVNLLSGRFDEAERAIKDATNIAKTISSKHDIAIALNNRGYLYHLKAYYDGAVRAYEDGLALYRVFGSRASAILKWSLGDVRRDMGGFEVAYDDYMQAFEFARRADPAFYNSICLSIARMRLWQEMNGDVQVWLKSLRHSPNDQALHYTEQIGQGLRMIREALQVRPDADTLAQLREILDDFNHKSMYTRVAQLLGLYLIVGLRYADEALVDDARQRLEALSPQFYQPIAADLVHMHGAMTQFREVFTEQLTTDFSELNQLMTDLNEIVRQRKPDAEQLDVHQIKLTTLGAELVTHNGKTISVKEWRIANARELFFYLHVKGPRTKSQIIFDFWPGRDEASAKNIFNDTLRYARKAFDIEDVILLDDDDTRGIAKCYRINPKIHIIWDVDRFMSFLSRAGDLPPRDTRSEDLYRRALDLYQGEFLPNVFSNWASDWRDKLISAYQSALMGIGYCMVERDDPASALTYFEQALTINALDEPAYQALMAAHAKMGRIADVRATYDRMARVLFDELQAQPSDESVSVMHEALEHARRMG